MIAFGAHGIYVLSQQQHSENATQPSSYVQPSPAWGVRSDQAGVGGVAPTIVPTVHAYNIL